MNLDNLYIERCIQLAKLGLGNTYPNPLVGSVIVYNDTIIGEGYHMKYGEPHAEVNAVNSVKDKSVLKDATIYVSLEPCSHYGKTPPCADLIIKHSFKRVVIGSKDPFEKVNGLGIEKLKKAGIQVDLSPLLEQCNQLNKRFFTYHLEKRPYVILKWAQSKNGYIDIERKDETGIFWITDKATKSLVHKWRTEEEAILIGGKTLLNDKPELTARHYQGNNPKRIVLDSKGNVDLQEFWSQTESDYTIGNVTNSEHQCNLNAQSILSKLYDLNIQSVIIEGGVQTLKLFIDSGLWDEARVLTGDINIDKGNSAPIIKGSIEEEYRIGNDQVKILRNA